MRREQTTNTHGPVTCNEPNPRSQDLSASSILTSSTHRRRPPARGLTVSPSGTRSELILQDLNERIQPLCACITEIDGPAVTLDQCGRPGQAVLI